MNFHSNCNEASDCVSKLWDLKIKSLFVGAIVFIIATTCSASVDAQQARTLVAGRNGLPPCNLDSFVFQAGAHSEEIYGDEGVNSKPPLGSFTKASRIDAGILDSRDSGLTTGHGSYMPDAWGADEYIQGPNGEWGQSGARGDSSASDMDGTAPEMGDDPTPTKGLPGSASGGISPNNAPYNVAPTSVFNVGAPTSNTLDPTLSSESLGTGNFPAP